MYQKVHHHLTARSIYLNLRLSSSLWFENDSPSYSNSSTAGLCISERRKVKKFIIIEPLYYETFPDGTRRRFNVQVTSERSTDIKTTFKRRYVSTGLFLYYVSNMYDSLYILL